VKKKQNCELYVVKTVKQPSLFTASCTGCHW